MCSSDLDGRRAGRWQRCEVDGLRGFQDDMGLATQRFVNDGLLQLADQRGQEDDHGHATRDTGKYQHGLHSAFAQIAQADQPGEGKPELQGEVSWSGRARAACCRAAAQGAAHARDHHLIPGYRAG